MSRFLVTGGAGYVGSHTVLALREQGHDVVVIDDLSQGHREAVPDGVDLVVCGLSDHRRIDEVFASFSFDGVLHFAALSLVGESMRQPMRYIAENLANTLWLADMAVQAGCLRFVLSSTAAVFGAPDFSPIDEAASLAPASPYGESKLMAECGLDWADRVHGLRFASLRYFNAAGADPQGRLGEDHNPETHLIPLAIDAALGIGPALTIFGTDYDTPDGTCIRDYVHVTDLAQAHICALRMLDHGRSLRYNVGSGTGYSVRQVIDTVQRISGLPVPYREGPRRQGDPAMLVAANARLQAEAGWRPCYPLLEDIVRTAWAWRSAHQQGYQTQRQDGRIPA